MKTYKELLNTPEWRAKRAKILEAANYQCFDCGRCKVGCERCDYHEDYVEILEVHHRYYKRGRKPWEYPDAALLCLCRSCHEERTLLNDVFQVAFGLLSKINQELLLRKVKVMLGLQIKNNPEDPMPVEDAPDELGFFFGPGGGDERAILMAD